MKPAQLSVMAGFLAYGGNGGVATLLPEIMFWWTKVCAEMAKDDRISRIVAKKFGDVPLTMERNRMVRVAKDLACDVLLMIDSDNVPDLYDGALPEAKPFWQTSFDFLYERKMRSVPSVIAAPYCGPPPHPVKGGCENVYVFHGDVLEGDVDRSLCRLTGYSREHASQMRGIQPMAAGPTGCILYSLDALDVMPVHKYTQEEILLQYKRDEISAERACRLLNMQSWFFYEYTNGEQTEKASTDDVTNTREIQMAGLVHYKEPIVFCNWDAWAGHYKPKCVGKPLSVCVEHINNLYREAVEQNVSVHDTMRSIDFTGGEKLGYVLPADEEPAEAASGQDESQPVCDSLRGAEPPSTTESPSIVTDPRTLDADACGQVNVQWRKRMVAGRVVTSVGGFGGGQTPAADLRAIAEIVNLVAVDRAGTPLRIAEIGSWMGESALAMHEGFESAGGTVFCVDTWEGSTSDMTSVIARDVGFAKLFATFQDNVGELIDKSIKVIRGESVPVAESMDAQELDLVFIDADHSYESCRADIRAWLPHVAAHGIIAGHDCCSAFPGVLKAVHEICDEAEILVRLVNGTSVWFFTKQDYESGLRKKQAQETKRPARPRKKKSLDNQEAPTDGQPVAAS